MFYNTIHIIFQINKIQWLIVEEFLHRIIITTILNYIWKKSQLLFYIQREGRVGKIRVVKGIELGFLLFFCRVDLVFAALIRVVTSNIEGSMIYTCLGIGVRLSKRRSNKVSSMWI